MRLIIVSNRVNRPEPGGKTASGGLAVALTKVLRVHGGVWFGWSGKVVEEPTVTPKVRTTGGITYSTIDLSPQNHREYYEGFANRSLWPIMHYRLDLVEFSRIDLSGYMRVNQIFADALAAFIKPDDVIWVHDYHLIPLGEELRKRGITNPIGFFNHIPWSPFEIFCALPGSRALLRGLSGYDLVGVQTQGDADNLTGCLIRDIGAKRGYSGLIMPDGKNLKIQSFPIGLDPEFMKKMAIEASATMQLKDMSESLNGQDLVIGVDRLDYSKGVVGRMEAFESFLNKNPLRKGKVTLLQISPSSRMNLPKYEAVHREVNEAAGRINGSCGELDWVPIRYVTKPYKRALLSALYRKARVGLVTPMRDGMNLVAKEYVASQDRSDPGVLILSRFAGASAQMSGAIIVNPYDSAVMGQAIEDALNMGKEERVARWRPMMDSLQREDVGWWTDSFLKELKFEAKNIRRRFG